MDTAALTKSPMEAEPYELKPVHRLPPAEAAAIPRTNGSVPTDGLRPFHLHARLVRSHPEHPFPADWATDAQLTALRRARTRRAHRLRADAKSAEQLHHERFAPATTPTDARRLNAVTATALLSFRAGCRQGESGCGEASIDDVAAVLDFAECSPQDAHQVLGVGEGNVVLARLPSQ